MLQKDKRIRCQLFSGFQQSSTSPIHDFVQSQFSCVDVHTRRCNLLSKKLTQMKRPRKPLPSGAGLSALTSAKGHPRRIRLDDPRIIAGRLGSLTSALERSIRNLTSQPFASEVLYVALTSAKGHSRRSCLDDLSRHSRPLPIVDICDRAFDLK